MSAPSFIVVGRPISTFTRTVVMALLAKQLPFEQVPVSPHSTETYTYNPLGYIPILIDQSGLDPIRLTESIAILHYLERCHPAPPLFQLGGNSLPERIDELCSFGATHLFPKLEFGVVKPRLAGQMQLIDENLIVESLAPGIKALRSVLAVLESMLSLSGPYCLGSHLTAADLFLFPPISDLLAFPEGIIVKEYPKVSKWCSFFGELDIAIKTREGTLAAGTR